jgi:hypothetical protein
MPTLAQTLPSNDLGFIKIIAALWGLEIESTEPKHAALELAEAMCDIELLQEVIDALNDQSQNALGSLIDTDGRMLWAVFSRRYGIIREMGAGKRDREQPHLKPASTSEALWYRGLIGRSFFETEQGLQEFAFVPDDLREVMGLIGFGEKAIDEGHEACEEKQETNPLVSVRSAVKETFGRPASPVEKAHLIGHDDRLLDDAVTLLAAIRIGIDLPQTPIPRDVVLEFLKLAKIISLESGKWIIHADAAKKFLESSRAEALKRIYDAWINDEAFNELRQVPGLIFEGEWQNSARATRHFLLSIFEHIPSDQWWSLPALIREIKLKHADFQRPAGDYDSWFIKRESDGAYLRGFAFWDEVDGALIRYMITNVLFWLGRVEIAGAEEGGLVTGFKLTKDELTRNAESGKLSVSSTGMISVPRYSALVTRYQVARFCEWDDEREGEYRYHVTTNSLKRGREQGLKPDQLIKLLQKHSAAPIPPAFVRSLQRWEINGTEARIENVTILKVGKPDVLNELRNSKAGRFLGDILSPTTIIIKDGALQKVLSALAELGLLAEVDAGEWRS